MGITVDIMHSAGPHENYSCRYELSVEPENEISRSYWTKYGVMFQLTQCKGQPIGTFAPELLANKFMGTKIRKALFDVCRKMSNYPDIEDAFCFDGLNPNHSIETPNQFMENETIMFREHK